MTNLLSAPPEVAETAPPLYGFEATKDDFTVMQAVASNDPTGGVRVVALVWNVRALTPQPPMRIARSFADLSKAKAFIDETAICLEYTGCEINQLPAM